MENDATVDSSVIIVTIRYSKRPELYWIIKGYFCASIDAGVAKALGIEIKLNVEITKYCFPF